MSCEGAGGGANTARHTVRARSGKGSVLAAPGWASVASPSPRRGCTCERAVSRWRRGEVRWSGIDSRKRESTEEPKRPRVSTVRCRRASANSRGHRGEQNWRERPASTVAQCVRVWNGRQGRGSVLAAPGWASVVSSSLPPQRGCTSGRCGPGESGARDWKRRDSRTVIAGKAAEVDAEERRSVSADHVDDIGGECDEGHTERRTVRVRMKREEGSVLAAPGWASVVSPPPKRGCTSGRCGREEQGKRRSDEDDLPIVRPRDARKLPIRESSRRAEKAFGRPRRADLSSSHVAVAWRSINGPRSTDHVAWTAADHGSSDAVHPGPGKRTHRRPLPTASLLCAPSGWSPANNKRGIHAAMNTGDMQRLNAKDLTSPSKRSPARPHSLSISMTSLLSSSSSCGTMCIGESSSISSTGRCL
jgi:hypothetical protein